MSIAATIRQLYVGIRTREVQRFLAGAQRSRAIQKEVLLQKLRRNADSDFGRKHGFGQIRSIEDFRRHVPVTTYEYFQSYIERVKQGEVEALFSPGTKLWMFALTSGTTDRSKYIPVTGEFFDEYRRGWNLWGVKMYRDHMGLTGKKTLKLGSDWRQHYTEGGTPCGHISGLVTETAPPIGRRLFLLPYEVCKITNPTAKHYTALRLSLVSRDVGWIATANPSTLVEFARLADRERESLIRDIHDGTLSAQVEVSENMRQAMAVRTALRDPLRARELEKIVERTGSLYPRDCWPGMLLLGLWLGGSASIYLPLLKQYYGEVPLRDLGLSASEGRMNIPVEDNNPAGVLEYITHFYEFIPEEEHGQQNPTVLEAHELEPGRNYYILLTSSNGLCRYDIHDVIHCDGFVGQAPVIHFLNKGAHFSSITGEKLTEWQVVTAVGRVFKELDLPLEHFTFAPTMGDRPGYVLLLEPGSHSGKKRMLASRIDARLSEINCEYGSKVETSRLNPLSVREVPGGTWAAYRAFKSAERGNYDDYKHPCLVHDLGFIDRLLETPRLDPV